MSHFVDQVQIKVASGDGGNGMVAWRREKYEPLGGPAGGNGGRGGSVFLEASLDLSTLLDFRYKSKFAAVPGVKGGPKGMHGRAGSDLILKVPVGTVVKDAESGNAIADLFEAGQRVLVAEGGRGGRGNCGMASPTKRAPYFCEPGEPGIERDLDLELKLLADVGIIGLPNAGKSTLLSVLTAAKPKIANYSFTTLEPNLGVARGPGGDGYVIADIPGLVEGAASGLGLGHKFLRHIERTRLLVHLVDASAEGALEHVRIIDRELHLYGNKLDQLPQILVLNKSDLIDEDELQALVERINRELPGLLSNQDLPGFMQLMTISCATLTGVDKLKNQVYEQLSKLPKPDLTQELVPDEKACDHGDSGILVYRKRKKFYVEGFRLERFIAITDMKSPESIHHLHQVMRAMGVMDALYKEGAEPGHEVLIGGISFTFGENLF